MTSNSRIQLTAMIGALACALITFSLSLEPAFASIAASVI
jgi:hypothetical protein